MNTKILSSFIFVGLIASIVLSGCGGNSEGKVYDIPDSIVANVGSKYLKLDISLRVKNPKKAAANQAEIRHIINKELTKLTPEDLKESKETTGEAKSRQDEIANKLLEALKGNENFGGITAVYFRTFVLQ